MVERFELTFYGTRGTRTVYGEQHRIYGGHTTCVGFRAGTRQIILDSGSGIVGLGNRLIQEHFASGSTDPLTTYLFHTHTHYDHICGLPYYVPLFLANATTYIYGPRNTQGSFREAIERFIHPPYHPVALHEMAGEKLWFEVGEPDVVYFLKGQEQPIILRTQHARQKALMPPDEQVEVVVRCLRGYNHPKNGVTIYRVECGGRSVVFATDVEGYVHGDQRLIQFAKDADVLIHDAMYTQDRYTTGPVPTQGWGHSTVQIATDVALQAEVGRLYMVHHDPSHDDNKLTEMEKLAQQRFSASTVARDNATVNLLEAFPTN
ncbi:MAG: MBL fold metallo-hydrolase [Myxococcota bacterium]